jgi:hypothetical protein
LHLTRQPLYATFAEDWRRGAYLDVEEVFGEDSGTMIDGDTGTIELTAKHLGGDWHAEHITSELNVSLEIVDVRGTFEDLKRGS